MRVEVTRDDIAKGVPVDYDYCPVARAMRRADGRPWCAGTFAAWLGGEEYLSSFTPFPPGVEEWVWLFDRGATDLHPITFEITPYGTPT